VVNFVQVLSKIVGFPVSTHRTIKKCGQGDYVVCSLRLKHLVSIKFMMYPTMLPITMVPVMSDTTGGLKPAAGMSSPDKNS